MPLDLHVLGLPLAFILSQDQTLHRIIFILYLKLCPVAPSSIPVSLPRIDALCFSVLLLYCLCPVFSMNFLCPSGMSPAPLSLSSPGPLRAPLPERDCKGTPFFFPSKLFFSFFHFFFCSAPGSILSLPPDLICNHYGTKTADTGYIYVCHTFMRVLQRKDDTAIKNRHGF